jgi:hypothetical protein
MAAETLVATTRSLPSSTFTASDLLLATVLIPLLRSLEAQILAGADACEHELIRSFIQMAARADHQVSRG